MNTHPDRRQFLVGAGAAVIAFTGVDPAWAGTPPAVLTGHGAPRLHEGKPGDKYIDWAANRIYGPKTRNRKHPWGPARKLSATPPNPHPTPLLADDFNRPDGPLGTAEIGGPWQITGGGAAGAAIQDEQYISMEQAAYTYAFLRAARTPLMISGTFDFGAVTASDQLAMIMSSDPTLTLGHMLHLTFSRTGARLTWWTPGHIDNDMAAGATEAAFQPALTGETTVSMTTLGNAVQVKFSDGVTMNAFDPHISQVAGSVCCWELTGSAAWNAIEAVG